MLIKGTTAKGDAIPMSPQEALKAAVGRACKACNTLETIYWVDSRSIKETKFNSMADKNGIWEAWVEGEAMIGRTIASTNEFMVPIPHKFSIHYKLSKDEWGIPDIDIVGIPVLTPVEMDPTKLSGPIPVAPPTTPKVTKTKTKVEEEKTK